MAFSDIFRDQRVLITGHTGFKGSWLAEWLLMLGAEVHGIALEPPTQPALFEVLALVERLHHHHGDIRDAAWVSDRVREIAPTFIFHLAAQSLVRTSYDQPVETFATNFMGTAHVLEALRHVDHACSVVAVTTDKCYENHEWVHSYREEDPMGGHDPYSASKGAAEILIASYRRSYFSAPDSSVKIASARAGNVIGGGDWAQDRILPDCIRALQAGTAIPVRNKISTRPWQHVLEPLSGYLLLAASIHQAATSADTSRLRALCSGFNFGPALTANRTVESLVKEVLLHWPGRWEDQSDPTAVHEAKLLNLATDKAFHHLHWQPVWPFECTIEQTISWYRQTFADQACAAHQTREQIRAYTSSAASLGLPWAKG